MLVSHIAHCYVLTVRQPIMSSGRSLFSKTDPLLSVVPSLGDSVILLLHYAFECSTQDKACRTAPPYLVRKSSAVAATTNQKNDRRMLVGERSWIPGHDKY